MDKKEDKVTKKIFSLALDILYLLTGENYTVVKKPSGDHMTPRSHPHLPGEWSSNQSLMVEPPPPSLKLQGNNCRKILEAANRIIELLTGEDDGVYFPMKEQNYVEDHCDGYKPPLTSVDGSRKRNTPERCPRPLYSRDSAQEEHRTLQGDGLIVVKVEVGEEADVRGEEPCEEEAELCPQISPDGQYRSCTSDDQFKVSPTRKIEDDLHFSSSENALQNSAHPCSDSPPNPPKHKPSFSEYVSSFMAEEPLLCTQQGTSTSQQASHTWEKPYSCSICGKGFTRKASLSMHEGVHLGVKPFSCSVCGKAFTQKSLLERHEKVHTGERPFSCSECGKCFRQKSHFDRHVRIHMGVKPFSCAQCGKRFTEKGDLISHQRTHTGEKPFSCFECGACFSWKVQLIRHQAVHPPRNISDVVPDVSNT